MTDQALALREARVPSAEAMAQMLAVAKALVDARMVPAGIKIPGEALALILTGREMGIGPLRSVQDLYPVHGNVGMMTKFMVAQFHLAGHTDKTLIRTEEHSKILLYLKDGRERVCEMTRKEADALGYPFMKEYVGKGANRKATGKWVLKPAWKRDPPGMLYNRNMTRGIRTHAPEVLYGLATQDEIEDQGMGPGESRLVAFLKEHHPDVWGEWAENQAPPAEESVPPPDAINGEYREGPQEGQEEHEPGTESGEKAEAEPHWIDRNTTDGRSLRSIFWHWSRTDKGLTDEQVFEALGTRDEHHFPKMEETKNLVEAYIAREAAIARAVTDETLWQQEIPFR